MKYKSPDQPTNQPNSKMRKNRKAIKTSKVQSINELESNSITNTEINENIEQHRANITPLKRN